MSTGDTVGRTAPLGATVGASGVNLIAFYLFLGAMVDLVLA